ncbi:unnamed protein product, partial [Prorocentrum cordatum]
MRVLVQYNDDPGWTHERLLLWPNSSDQASWVVCAAGNDLNTEVLEDYSMIAQWTGRGRYPAGVRNVVAFRRELQLEETVSLVKRGRGEAALELGAASAAQTDYGPAGRPALPLADGVPPPPGPPDDRPPGSWVLAALAGGEEFGCEVELSAAAILRGRRGLDRNAEGEWVPMEYVKMEAVEGRGAPGAGLGPAGGQGDFGACWVDVGETGSRFEEWRKVAQESAQVCRKMCRSGGAPKICFQGWCKETGILRRDRAYHEAQTLPECLRLAGASDQLKLGALASLEVVAGGLPRCTEACARGADRANWGAAKNPAGTSNLDVAPEALRSYASWLSKEGRELEALRARAKVAELEMQETEAVSEGSAGLQGSSFLPLAPLTELPDCWCEGPGAARRRRWLRDGRAACESLNCLRGGAHRADRSPPSLVSQLEMDAAWADVRRRVFSAARRWIDVDSAVAEEEAFAGLLKGKAGCVPLGSTSMGSDERSRLSLPDSVVDAPSSATALPVQARLYLRELARRMLLPPKEAALMRGLDGVPGCHVDPLLQRPRSYGKFA